MKKEFASPAYIVFVWFLGIVLLWLFIYHSYMTLTANPPPKEKQDLSLILNIPMVMGKPYSGTVKATIERAMGQKLRTYTQKVLQNINATTTVLHFENGLVELYKNDIFRIWYYFQSNDPMIGEWAKPTKVPVKGWVITLVRFGLPATVEPTVSAPGQYRWEYKYDLTQLALHRYPIGTETISIVRADLFYPQCIFDSELPICK